MKTKTIKHEAWVIKRDDGYYFSFQDEDWESVFIKNFDDVYLFNSKDEVNKIIKYRHLEKCKSQKVVIIEVDDDN